MADVFISYASEDRDRVRPLAQALEGRGFSIWWDRALASGQDYATVIERELKNCKAVIVVWTRASAASTYVRDEAGRARDEGRLLPVMLDPVQPPLGFGSYQADDFTKWSGQRNAAQVQILEESIKAKLAGRDVDTVAVQRKRARLGARIRMVSLLTVVGLVVAIAAGGKYLVQPPHLDPKAQLLQLLSEGKLTPEQAIQLAQLLETDTVGSTGSQAASLAPGGSSSAGAPAPALAARSADEETSDAVVTDAEFTTDVSQTYNDAFAKLLTHPALEVRTAALQMTQDATRNAGIQALWAYAQAHPDDPERQQMYLVCGAIAEKNNNPLAEHALQAASNLAPDNPRVWRMLSHSYQRANQASEAQAAAQVGAGVEAQAQGQTDAAEQHFQEALPNLSSVSARAFAASSLGTIAERRQDWTSASARFSEAYRLREQAATETPNATAASSTNLAQDARSLVNALDRSGRTQEACQRAQQAQDAHNVTAPDDQNLTERCQTQFRIPLRARIGAQRAARQTTTTATTTTATTTGPVERFRRRP